MSKQGDRQKRGAVVEAGLAVEELARRADAKFLERFGRSPGWIAAAPGRVNLIGEHTDYNDGFVLPMAIERYTVVAADRSVEHDVDPNSQTIRVHSEAMGETQSFQVTGEGVSRASDWTDYVRGVVAGCRQAGLRTDSLDVLIESNVPLGGGLSSSAALEVAVATLIEAASGRSLDPAEKAFLCQRAEHEYGGVPCGIMDQFSSVMGQPLRLMLLDCRAITIEPIPLSGADLTVLIVNSNVKHELVGGEYAERRSQCQAAAEVLGVPALRDATLDCLDERRGDLEPVLYRRARHVISENERTVAAAAAIRAADWPTVGELMYASHQSLRDDYEVSCDELDLLVELTREIGEAGGVIGSRMTGGGFGGCTVSLVKAESFSAVAKAVHAGYRKQTGIEPTVFVSRPARGAHVVETIR